MKRKNKIVDKSLDSIVPVVAVPYVKQKKTVVELFLNETHLSQYIAKNQDYVIITVFPNEGHITGIFMYYE